MSSFRGPRSASPESIGPQSLQKNGFRVCVLRTYPGMTVGPRAFTPARP